MPTTILHAKFMKKNKTEADTAWKQAYSYNQILRFSEEAQMNGCGLK